MGERDLGQAGSSALAARFMSDLRVTEIHREVNTDRLRRTLAHRASIAVRGTLAHGSLAATTASPTEASRWFGVFSKNGAVSVLQAANGALP